MSVYGLLTALHAQVTVRWRAGSGAAVALQSLGHSEGWSTTVIDGLAVQRWGEPRQSSGR